MKLSKSCINSCKYFCIKNLLAPTLHIILTNEIGYIILVVGIIPATIEGISGAMLYCF